MGAWIEIKTMSASMNDATPSHPSWVRGLKSYLNASQEWSFSVAPLVGAWIEIISSSLLSLLSLVAPLVGAWIEIDLKPSTLRLVFTKVKVAPLVGAWIEI